MKKGKEAHGDIYDTVVNLKHIRYVWYAAGCAGLFFLCRWAYETDRNRGLSMAFLCVVGIVGWLGLQKLRRDGWFPSWPPPQEKVKKAKAQRPQVPRDGSHLDDYEQQKFKDIMRNFDSDSG